MINGYLMATIIVHPLVLFALLWVFARDAELNLLYVFFVALGLGVGCLALYQLLTPHLGVFVIFPMLALGMFLLMRFCAVTLGRALIVVVLHAACCFGLAYLTKP